MTPSAALKNSARTCFMLCVLLWALFSWLGALAVTFAIVIALTSEFDDLPNLKFAALTYVSTFLSTALVHYCFDWPFKRWERENL